MISAVENHLGPGRGGGYAQYPFGGPSNPLLSSISHPGLPNVNSSSVAANLSAMSATEFVRPHPKPRYNGASALRNGLSTAPQRAKYAEQQNGPVNLAVGSTNSGNGASSGGSLHSATTNLSPKIESITLDQQQPKDCDIISPYSSSSRLQFPSSSQLVGTNAYQALNYSLYSRGYGNPTALYPPHMLSSRAPMHHRPTYISNQLDGYSYLPPVNYSPPSGGPPVILPPPISSSLPIPPPNTSLSLAQHQQQQLQQQLQHHHHQQQQHHLSQNGLPPSSSNKPSGYNGHIDRAILHNSSTSSSGSSPSTSSSLAHHMPSSPIYSREKENKVHLQMLQQQQQQQQHREMMINAGNGMNGKHSAIDMEFKVPSGKEGSLKHRILTRPYGEKDLKRRTSPVTSGGSAATIIRASDNNATTNFTKGSLIELASGDYRRIEDLRTEDFILSAEKSPELQLADSTVVNILVHNNLVIITFSYDSNRGKADIEATLEHPFFVYGQGWASCNPEGSLQLFGLKCQRLQVGDICISLKPREHKVQHQPKHQLQQPNDYSGRHHPNSNYSMHHPKNGFPMSPSQVPQNLSKRPQTNTTNATDITVASRLAPHLVPYSSVQSLASSTTSINGPSAAEIRNSHIESIVNGIAAGRGLSSPPQRRRPLSHENPTSTLKVHADDSQPVSMVLNEKSRSPTSGDESGTSRKRRWSAPDIIDDEDDQMQQRLQPPNSQLARTIGN